MNFIKKIFYRKKTINQPNSTTDNVIQNLHQTESNLLRKQEGLEQKINEELEVAKQHRLQNKRIALQALKKKKRYEKQLRNIDDTLSALAIQREALQNVEVNTTVVSAMQNSAEALKNTFETIDLQLVEDLVEKSAEEQAILAEIDSALSEPGDKYNDVSHADLERELEQLIFEELDKLPDIPSDKLPDMHSDQLACSSNQKICKTKINT